MEINQQKLSKLGFTEDTFTETVTFFLINDDKKYVMALGIKRRNSYLYARIFRGSKIYSVIVDNKNLKLLCRVCISRDPLAFYYSIFRKNILLKCYNELRCIKRFCDAYIDAILDNLKIKDEAIEIFLKPIDIKILKRYPKGFNRASAAIIEALIYYTKMPFVNEDEKKRALLKIDMCRETVYRSSENPIYRKIIDEIIKRVPHINIKQ